MTKITDPDHIKLLRTLGPEAFPVGTRLRVKNHGETALQFHVDIGVFVVTPAPPEPWKTYTPAKGVRVIWANPAEELRKQELPLWIRLDVDCIAEVEIPD